MPSPRNPVNTVKLRQAIKASELTQTKLADTVGVGPPMITRYMNGTRKPGPLILVRLATALNVKLEDLIGQ